jgi:hypothetical protein
MKEDEILEETVGLDGTKVFPALKEIYVIYCSSYWTQST